MTCFGPALTGSIEAARRARMSLAIHAAAMSGKTPINVTARPIAVTSQRIASVSRTQSTAQGRL